VIAWHGGASAPLAGTLLALASALAWALCNTVARRIERERMFAFIVLASALSVPPLLAATLLLEGGEPLIRTFAHPGAAIIAIVAWQSFANSLWGYTVWNRLLGRYGATQVAPFTLPVPMIAGILSGLFLGESLGLWKIGACVLVLSGVAINLAGQRHRRRVSPDGI
jgi:O-acetylserine/cysteine efflux transporter